MPDVPRMLLQGVNGLLQVEVHTTQEQSCEADTKRWGFDGWYITHETLVLCPCSVNSLLPSCRFHA